MTTTRFLAVKDTKLFFISICLPILASRSLSGDIDLVNPYLDKLEQHLHSIEFQYKSYSLADHNSSALLDEYIEQWNELHSECLRGSHPPLNHRMINLSITSNNGPQKGIEDIEVDFREHSHETSFKDISSIDVQHTNQNVNSPHIQIEKLDEEDFLDASKINESRLSTRSLNVKTIETAIFADRALNQKFNGRGGLIELNKLILTIMNQVQLIFSFRSMKTPIKINIVRIEHLKDSVDPPSTENGDIDGYLSSFCKWQHNMLLKDKYLAWDHAILLTGLDLYKSTLNRNHSGVLGLAWVGGMCKQNYSCTINEALSLESAFVIAHEMGHSLGILHDGQQNNCDRNNFIMSERTGAGKIHWSSCSNYYLSDAIRRRQLFCLDNEKNSVMDIYNLSKMKSPGQVYSVNDQCRLAFGSNYTAFITREKPFNSVCRELWCVAGTWAKAAHPALEGSLCGDTNKFCNQGECKPNA